MAQMDPRHRSSALAQLLAGGTDRPLRGTPTDREHVAAGGLHVERRQVLRDAGDPGVAQVGHPLMVGRVVADVARVLGLLEPTDAVLEARCPRNGPGARERLRVPLVWQELPVLAVRG